jgi:hypothetical protein
MKNLTKRQPRFLLVPLILYPSTAIRQIELGVSFIYVLELSYHRWRTVLRGLQKWNQTCGWFSSKIFFKMTL